MKRFMKKIMCFVLALAMIIPSFDGIDAEKAFAKSRIRLSSRSVTIRKGQKKKLTLRGVRKGAKVRWSVKNKRIVKVSQRGYIRGLRAGRTVVTAKYGKRSYRCTVRVKKKKKNKKAKDTDDSENETGSPDISTSPAGTAGTSGTSGPAQTEGSSVNESGVPADNTSLPEETEEPVVPVITGIPVPTASKEAEETPGSTEDSDATVSPENTPGETESPEKTASPESTPGGTVISDATVSPENTPDETVTPEETVSPENTPGGTDDQGGTPVPEETVSPENTPEDTGSSDSTATPAGTPKETEGQDETPSPEKTVSPSPEITESPVPTDVPSLSGKITVEDHFWETLLEKITFGLYSADKEVTVESTGDPAKIWYHVEVSNDAHSENDTDTALTEEDLDNLDDNEWHEYTSGSKLKVSNNTVVYVKLVSTKDSDVHKYISSDGILLSSGDTKVMPETVELSAGSISLKIGGSSKIGAKILPADATDNTLEYESSDKSVASVGNDGTVTGISAGKTTVTVRAAADRSVSAYVNVTVIKTDVEKIELTPSEVILAAGGSALLSAAVYPADASVRDVVWSVSDEKDTSGNKADGKVVSVDAAGNVTALGAGTATVTAASKDNKDVTASCTVTVKAKEVNASGIGISSAPEELDMGESAVLKAAVTPADTTDTIVWSSSDESIASVDQSGRVTGKAEGDVTITARAGSVSDSVTIHINKAVVYASGISAGQTEISLYKGGTQEVSVSVLPENVSDRTVTWKVSDRKDAAGNAAESGIVTVTPDDDTSGAVITASEPGSARITASVSSGENDTLSASIDVKVLAPVTEVTLNKKTLTISMGSDGKEAYTGSISASVNDDASDQSITWKSSDESIASVSENGLVTAKAPGTAVITATASNGVNASCTVTVNRPASGITIPGTLSVLEGEEKSITAVLAPEDTTDDASEIKWSVSDEKDADGKEASGKIAAVDSGKVKAGAAGTAVVKAVINGNTAECKVTVSAKKNHLKSIALGDDISLNAGKTGAFSYKEEAEDTSSGTTDTLVWSVSDEKDIKGSAAEGKIISIDSATGLITAISAGTATVTVRSSEKSDVTDSAKVTVNNPVTGITLSASEMNVSLGKTAVITYSVKTADGKDTTDTLKWTSDNEDTATVTGGRVTGVKKGDAVITLKASGGVSASCRIHVYTTAVNSLSIKDSDNNDITSASLEKGEELAVKASINSDATYKTIKWTTSDSSKATVAAENESGSRATVKASGTGTVRITATAEGDPDDDADDKIASITVNIKVSATGIKLSADEGTVLTGSGTSYSVNAVPQQAGTITAGVLPEGSTDTVSSVTSGDTDIIEVTKTAAGFTYKAGSKTGNADVTIKTSNGLSVAVKFTVAVVEVTSVTMEGTGITAGSVSGTYDAVIEKGSALTFAAETNADATNRNVTYNVTSQKDASGADAEGIVSLAADASDVSKQVITALGNGTAVIKAEASNGVSAELTVKVVSHIKAITLSSGTELGMKAGNTDEYEITAVPDPADTTDTIYWTISDSSVVEITTAAGSDGKVSGRSIKIKAAAAESEEDRTATLTAYSSADESIRAVTEITVSKNIIPAESIEITSNITGLTDGSEVESGEVFKLTASILPSDTTDKVVNWSTDSELAAVDNDGKVTINDQGKAGKVTVNATAGKITKSFTVTVKPVYISGISLTASGAGVEKSTSDQDLYTVKVGDGPVDIIYELSPDNATYKDKIDWSYEDSDAFTFTKTNTGLQAKVSGTTAGKAEITLTAADTERTGGVLSKTITLASETVPVTDITLSGDTSVTRGSTVNVNVTKVAPENATVKDVKWSIASQKLADGTELDVSDTADENVVSLSGSSDSCIVKGIKAGTAVIKAEPADGGNGKAAVLTVTVNPLKVTGVSLSKTSASVTSGKDTVLTAEALPAGADDNKITWKAYTDKECTKEAGESLVTLADPVESTGGSSSETVTAASGIKEETTVYIKASADEKSAVCVLKITPVRVTAVSADKSSISADLTGKAAYTESVGFNISPSDAADKSVKVTSSDEDTASAEVTEEAGQDGKGTVKITVKKTGTAKITVTSNDDSTASAAINITSARSADKVTITDAGSAGSSAEITGGSTKALTSGEILTINVSAAGSDGSAEADTTDSISVSSSDSSTVSVKDAGSGSYKLTAVKSGSSEITVKAGKVTSTFTVTVSAPAAAGISLTSESSSLTLESSAAETGFVSVYKASLKETVSGTVSVSLTPSKTEDTVSKAESSDKNVAEVSENSNGTYTITAVGAGTADIVFTATDGIKSKISITVESGTVLPESVSITGADVKTGTSKTLELYRNSKKTSNTEQLSVAVLPANATDQTVTWTSSDTDIATVSTTGLVTANKNGTAEITAVSNADGTVKDSVTVTVKSKVTAISISQLGGGVKTYFQINMSKDVLQYSFKADVTPDDADNKGIKWTTSDENVLKITGGETDELCSVKVVGTGNARLTCTAADGDGASENVTFSVTNTTSSPSASPTATPEASPGTTPQATATPVKVTKITLSETEVNLTVHGDASDRKKTVTADVYPENAANKKLKWESLLTESTDSQVTNPYSVAKAVTYDSDEDKLSATVNANGSIGTIKIRVSSVEDENIYAEFTVNVTEAEEPETGGKISVKEPQYAASSQIINLDDFNGDEGNTYSMSTEDRIEASETYYNANGEIEVSLQDENICSSDKISIMPSDTYGTVYYYALPVKDIPVIDSDGNRTTDINNYHVFDVYNASGWLTDSDFIEYSGTFSLAQTGTETIFTNSSNSSGVDLGYMIYIKFVNSKGKDIKLYCLDQALKVKTDSDAESYYESNKIMTEKAAYAPSDEGNTITSLPASSSDKTLTVGGMSVTIGTELKYISELGLGTEVRSFTAPQGFKVYVFNPDTAYTNLLYVYVKDNKVIGVNTVSAYARYSNIVYSGEDISSTGMTSSSYGLTGQYHTSDGNIKVEAYTDASTRSLKKGKVYGIRVYDTTAVSEYAMNKLDSSLYTGDGFTKDDSYYVNKGMNYEMSELLLAYDKYEGISRENGDLEQIYSGSLGMIYTEKALADGGELNDTDRDSLFLDLQDTYNPANEYSGQVNNQKLVYTSDAADAMGAAAFWISDDTKGGSALIFNTDINKICTGVASNGSSTTFMLYAWQFGQDGSSGGGGLLDD